MQLMHLYFNDVFCQCYCICRQYVKHRVIIILHIMRAADAHFHMSSASLCKLKRAASLTTIVEVPCLIFTRLQFKGFI